MDANQARMYRQFDWGTYPPQPVSLSNIRAGQQFIGEDGFRHGPWTNETPSQQAEMAQQINAEWLERDVDALTRDIH